MLLKSIFSQQCEHAMAVYRNRDFLIYDYCSHYYSAWMSAYFKTIYLVSRQEGWDVSGDVCACEVYPPLEKQSSGQSKNNRIPSKDKEKLPSKCSRCGGRRHNRLKCMTPMLLHEEWRLVLNLYTMQMTQLFVFIYIFPLTYALFISLMLFKLLAYMAKKCYFDDNKPHVLDK